MHSAQQMFSFQRFNCVIRRSIIKTFKQQNKNETASLESSTSQSKTQFFSNCKYFLPLTLLRKIVQSNLIATTWQDQAYIWTGIPLWFNWCRNIIVFCDSCLKCFQSRKRCNSQVIFKDSTINSLLVIKEVFYQTIR